MLLYHHLNISITSPQHHHNITVTLSGSSNMIKDTSVLNLLIEIDQNKTVWLIYGCQTARALHRMCAIDCEFYNGFKRGSTNQN